MRCEPNAAGKVAKQIAPSQHRASPGHPGWRQKIGGKYERDGGTCGYGSTDNRGCKTRDLGSRKRNVGVKVKRRKVGRMGHLWKWEEVNWKARNNNK
jgi:hypothetical protein